MRKLRAANVESAQRRKELLRRKYPAPVGKPENKIDINEFPTVEEVLKERTSKLN
jgi:hypothetical protein